MLRQYIIDEVILSNETGLGNPNINGYYFDDAWFDKPRPKPPGVGPSYQDCASSPIGGATEEDANCVDDMGLTQDDTTAMVADLTTTMDQVNAAIVAHGGFSTRMIQGQAPAAIDDNSTDPRTPERCNAFMRRYCKASNPLLTTPYIYEWTRKSFHDISPIPAVTQDLARFLLIRGEYKSVHVHICMCVHER